MWNGGVTFRRGHVNGDGRSGGEDCINVGRCTSGTDGGNMNTAGY